MKEEYVTKQQVYEALGDDIGIYGRKALEEIRPVDVAPMKMLEDATLQVTVPTDTCMKAGRVLLEDGRTVGNLFYQEEADETVYQRIVHGTWFLLDTYDYEDALGCTVTASSYKCSNCGRIIKYVGDDPALTPLSKFPYCHCGARMDGE